MTPDTRCRVRPVIGRESEEKVRRAVPIALTLDCTARSPLPHARRRPTRAIVVGHASASGIQTKWSARSFAVSHTGAQAGARAAGSSTSRTVPRTTIPSPAPATAACLRSFSCVVSLGKRLAQQAAEERGSGRAGRNRGARRPCRRPALRPVDGHRVRLRTSGMGEDGRFCPASSHNHITEEIVEPRACHVQLSC